MSLAAVRLALLSAAHGRPAGSRLGRLLPLGPGGAAVLPAGRPLGSCSLLPRCALPPRPLPLPAQHARGTLSSFRGAGLQRGRGREPCRVLPRAAGGIQTVPLGLAALVGRPAVALPHLQQPAARPSRPASPLPDTVTEGGGKRN